jgi:hypothetical protein
MGKLLTINRFITVSCMTAFVLALTAGQAAAQSTPAKPATEFSWSAELAALDEATRMVTVKARVVGDLAKTGFTSFKANERILLTWSGYDRYADAISRASRYDAAKKHDERFTFPVEYVSWDAGRQYLTFKVLVPADSVAKLKALKPGEWITATSPHGKTSDTQPVVSARPYVESSGSK